MKVHRVELSIEDKQRIELEEHGRIFEELSRAEVSARFQQEPQQSRPSQIRQLLIALVAIVLLIAGIVVAIGHH